MNAIALRAVLERVGFRLFAEDLNNWCLTCGLGGHVTLPKFDEAWRPPFLDGILCAADISAREFADSLRAELVMEEFSDV